MITDKYLHGGDYGHREDLLGVVVIRYRAQHGTEI